MSSFSTKNQQKKSLNAMGIGDCHTNTVNKRCVVQLQSRGINNFKITLYCIVLDNRETYREIAKISHKCIKVK